MKLMYNLRRAKVQQVYSRDETSLNKKNNNGDFR